MGDDVHIRVQASTNLFPAQPAAPTSWPRRTLPAWRSPASCLGQPPLLPHGGDGRCRRMTGWAAQVPGSVDRHPRWPATGARSASSWPGRMPGTSPRLPHRRRAVLLRAGTGDERATRRRQRRAGARRPGRSAAAGSRLGGGLRRGSMSDAAAMTAQLDLICVGRSTRFKLPTMGWRGTTGGCGRPEGGRAGRHAEGHDRDPPRLRRLGGRSGPGWRRHPSRCFQSAAAALDRARPDPLGAGPAGVCSRRRPGPRRGVASAGPPTSSWPGRSSPSRPPASRPAPLHLRFRRSLPRLQVGDRWWPRQRAFTIGTHTVARAELVGWRPPVVPGPALAARSGARDGPRPRRAPPPSPDDPAAAAPAGRPASCDLPPRWPCWPGGDLGSRRPVTTCWPGSCSCWPSPATTGP